MSTDNSASDYKTLTIEYEFDAAREAVWDAWTKPEHFAQWFAPDYFTVPVCELDVRPGGNIHIDMQGPDGTIYPSSGVFQEVIKPQRLVLINSPLDAQGKKLFEVQHSVELSEKDGKTLFHLASEVLSATPEAAPYLAGMETGLNQSLEKLRRLLEK